MTDVEKIQSSIYNAVMVILWMIPAFINLLILNFRENDSAIMLAGFIALLFCLYKVLDYAKKIISKEKEEETCLNKSE